MGLFDTVMVPCPKCGTRAGFQSKGGERKLLTYELNDCPPDVMGDLVHDSATCAQCGSRFRLMIQFLALPVLCSEDADDHDVP
jgi:hypothetical protein